VNSGVPLVEPVVLLLKDTETPVSQIIKINIATMD